MINYYKIKFYDIIYKVFKKYVKSIIRYERNLTGNFNDDLLKFKTVKLTEELLIEIKNIYQDEFNENKYYILLSRINNDKKECYIVIDNNKKICGYYCLAYENTYISEMDIIGDVKKEEVYLFDDYTFINHRNKGVHKFAIKIRCEIAKEKGYKRAVIMVQEGNDISKKSVVSSKFVEVEKYYFLTISSFKKCFKRIILRENN